MKAIQYRVGINGLNRPDDVLIIQQLINLNAEKLHPIPMIPEDKKYSHRLSMAIILFQTRIMKVFRPDGNIDPDGKTIIALNQIYTNSTFFPKLAHYNSLQKLRTITLPSKLPQIPNHYPFPKVNYSKSLSPERRIVSLYSMQIIEIALKKAGMNTAIISSTIRTPEKQAEIMYHYAKLNLAQQRLLYTNQAGKSVLDLFEQNIGKLDSDKIIELMKCKIEFWLGKNIKISKHLNTIQGYKSYNVIDISVNETKAACSKQMSMKVLTKAFIELKDEGYINKFIDETELSNNAWHVEIIPNVKPSNGLKTVV